MQQLPLNKLNNYCLFCSPKNELISNAFFVEKNKIEIRLKKNLPYNSSIQIFSQDQEQLKNIEIVYFEDLNKIIVQGEFKYNENYKLKINKDSSYIHIAPTISGILDKDYFSDDQDFGITFNKNSIKFKLWSPPATKVEILLFDAGQNLIKTKNPIQLKSIDPGIWETTVKKTEIGLSFNNDISYQYKINAYGNEYIGLDPYALSMPLFDSHSSDKTGKAAVIDLNSSRAKPPNFKKSYSNFKHIENETDLIGYELNIRDFTIQPGLIDETIAGTFIGLTKKIDYLKDLGITHVQLMPVNKSYTQNENNKSFTGKSSKESNYNWGYDPMNFFTLEGRYSTNSNDPYLRIFEFKEMIQTLHDAGIGIILDVVFNHSYLANTFEHIAPGCYYRLTDDYKISGHTGAGATIECRRKQVRKYIIDILKFFVSEYHIDGFRFDLMSFFDNEMMQMIRREVGIIYNPKDQNELILQGEAWNFTDLEKNAFTKNDFESLNIGIFNDSMRDSIAGDIHQKGFIQGNLNEKARLASAVIGGVKSYDSSCLPFNKHAFFDPYNLFAVYPNECLNYLSIHDGQTLWDKINLSFKDESKEIRLRMMKFAYAILLTSQGKIIMHGGDEMLRTKPLADFDKERTRAFTSNETDYEENSVFFHENTYCSSDFTNMFRWDRLTNEFSEFSHDLINYIKGLIMFRRKYSAFRLNKSEDINNKIKFIDSDYNQESLINSFKSHKLKSLKLRFINGPKNEILFLVGEIHKNDDNPVDNPYILNFDDLGEAEIIFNRTDIENFNLNRWDTSRNLNFKLIETKGKWDYLKDSYSKFGHNSVSPEIINEHFEIIIDLNIKDQKQYFQNEVNKQNPYIIYFIDDSKKDDIKSNHNLYNKFLIIHNSSLSEQKIKIDELLLSEKWDIPVDNNRVTLQKPDQTNIKITGSEIVVPQLCTTVLASV